MFEVGGCVRDEILGTRSKDIDFSVVLDPSDRVVASAMGESYYDHMVKRLENMGVKVFRDDDGVPIGAEHVTARGQAPKTFPNHPGRALDFVLARKEGEYSDGRRPDSVEPGTLMDDLARRDFTMNAIAKDTDGSYIDPFDGRKDIENRIIRAVGDPMDRLTEDALRAVRAIRFRVTKGMVMDGELCVAIQSPEVLERIRDKSIVADERIKDEVEKMFAFSTMASFEAFGTFPLLTEALFSGTVGLTATMKTKGTTRAKKEGPGRPFPPSRNGCKCRCHSSHMMHMSRCC